MLLLPHLFETPKAHAYLENNLTMIDWRLFDLCRLTLIEPRSFCFTGGSPKCQTRASRNQNKHCACSGRTFCVIHFCVIHPFFAFFAKKLHPRFVSYTKSRIVSYTFLLGFFCVIHQPNSHIFCHTS